MPAKPIPEGYHAVTPYLVVDGAGRLMDFLQDVFGAQEIMRMAAPDGQIGHAEVCLGDSIMMIADATPEYPATSPMLFVYVDDVDETYRKAVAAGGTSTQEPADQFYGDRTAGATAFGIRWYIATHVEDIAPDEMERRGQAALAETTG
jgi:uncharacterized glyoxalase superfamily protein PhnB